MQGGCARACQVERMALDGGGTRTIAQTGSLAGNVAVTPGKEDSDSRSDRSGLCACEFRKGLAQPERTAATTFLFYDAVAVFGMHLPGVLRVKQVSPVPSPLSSCEWLSLPLLI